VSNAQEEIGWIDRPYTALLRLAWPIAVSMLSYAVMTLVGTLFVGRLGPSALGGVGLGGVAAFTLLCFGLGALRAVKVIVSQAVGAGQSGQLRAWVGAGIGFALVLGVLALALGPLLAHALSLLATGGESGRLASEYLLIRNLGSPLVLVSAALREVRYGLSDSRAPMRAAVAANLINIALDAWFIFGLDWGVKGVAWATVIAHAFELVLLVRAQRSAGFGLRAFGAKELRRLWGLGWPLGVQFLLEVGAFATLVAILARISEVDLAAHQVALQLVHFSFLPALAIGEAASVLSGQAVGAGRDRLVHGVARRALWLAAGYTGFCALVLAVFAHPLAAAFSDDAGVRSLSARLLYVAAAFNLFDGAAVVARGVLRGAGDVRYAALVGVLTAWVSTPPLTVLLGITLGLGALGGWLGLCAEIIVGALIMWHRLISERWLSAARRSRAELASQARDESGLAAALPGNA
jgi:multidrug resistance protein, MATE family